MVHYKKTFGTYLFFASSLIGLRQDLAFVRSFGTDGEIALYDAFKQAFSSSTHLLCSIHMRRNIKAKMSELHVPENLKGVILDDLFFCK